MMSKLGGKAAQQPKSKQQTRKAILLIRWARENGQHALSDAALRRSYKGALDKRRLSPGLCWTSDRSLASSLK